jgi:glycosyltransferase involved in cell wall biosynthesis
MRLLLVQNSLYYPAYGGGNKSNRLMLEALAARGHACRVVTRISESGDAERVRLFLADLESRGVPIESTAGGVIAFHLNGVEIHAETSVVRMREHLIRQVREYGPTFTLVSTDDPLQVFLRIALDCHPQGVIFLARTTLSLPFGPDTAIASEHCTQTLRKVSARVAVSNYVARYIREWGGLEAVTLPISLHGSGPFPNLASFDSGFVTMVNPCAIKGIGIFLELAERLPEAPFAAVPMWGTNEQDLDALERLPNMRLLPPVDDIDRVLAQTRVLLAPSLCNDANPRIVMEAMSRGIPVLASNVGGVAEAKLGVDYLLPVKPVRRYESRVDSQMVPKASIPKQDVAPWLEALRRLLADREHYTGLSAASHRAASTYIASLSIAPFEEYLERLTVNTADEGDRRLQPLESLSHEKRTLLALKLRSRRKGD